MDTGDRSVQYAAGICVSLTMIFQGLIFAWPSPNLPKLLGGEVDVEITKEECSWVVSVVALGAVPGCLIAQYLVDLIGRKITILLIVVPAVAGIVMTLYATHYLIMARLISGMAGSMSIVAVSIYIGEISDKKIRGRLGTLLSSMTNVGNLIVFSIGPFVSYKTINLICLAIPIIVFIFCTWIPESPYYYLKKNDLENASKALMRLKNVKDRQEIEQELSRLQIQVKNDMERKTSIYELLKRNEYRKAVIILGGLKVLQQMTGSLVIQSYLQTIFRQTSLQMSEAVASILYGFVQLFAGMIATVLVDKSGRKPLLLISSFGVGISLTAVGIYFYMQDVVQLDQSTMNKLSWLPVTGILGFNILYAIGIGNLPYVLQAELFPTNVKSAASSIATIFGALLAFGNSKAYQALADSIGIHYVFWIYATFSFAGVLFIYFKLFETKGKTLDEIQRLLRNDTPIQTLPPPTIPPPEDSGRLLSVPTPKGVIEIK